jgi:hypothetical protein
MQMFFAEAFISWETSQSKWLAYLGSDVRK